jgi:cytochrome c peroxidase
MADNSFAAERYAVIGGSSWTRFSLRGAGLALLGAMGALALPALAQTLPPLVPPQPLVNADPNMATAPTLTLEQAGILNPDGRKWALVLGKALFWDQQVGSDGNACASCHFHAGTDTRLRNQLNPGFNDITINAGAGDTAFGSQRSDTGTVAPGKMPSGATAGANYLLKPADMPLHKLLDERNRNSQIVTTTNDRVSSQGAFDGTFTRVKILGQPDKCQSDGEIFHVGALAARQVEPRNTPTTINAAFFHRNFWDGRANNMFNGVGVFGMRDIIGDPNKRLIVRNSSGQLVLDYLRVENASLASQAMAPPINDVEMSCDGRTFADIGRKLLLTVPLLKQKISKTDSVLGPYVSASGKGLKLDNLYAFLIMKAFDPKYWSALGRYKIANGQLVPSATGYSQMETNFSMFWGISIMLYELTLVSDQSDFDNLVAAGKLSLPPGFGAGCTGTTTGPLAVDPLLLRGCQIFTGVSFGPPGPVPAGNCSLCHLGTATATRSFPMLAEGAFQQGETFPPFLNPVPDVNGVNDLRDNGFASIGLRPPFTDLMSGRVDSYGYPLSFGRQYWNYIFHGQPVLDPPLKRAIASGLNGTGPMPVYGTTTPPPFPPPPPGTPPVFVKLEVDGSAKAPILRNVALTPPYFSWGGYPNLRQMLKTYNRGLNRRDIALDPTKENAAGANCTSGDNSGTGPQGNSTLQSLAAVGSDCNTNTTGAITPLGLLDCDPDPVHGNVPPAACAGKTAANDDLAALEKFLKSLTDPRVQCDKAPFDHPQLTVLNGHKTTDTNHDGRADDITFSLPEVGAAGYAASSGYCIPNAGDLFAPGMQARSGGTKVPLQ